MVEPLEHPQHCTQAQQEHKKTTQKNKHRPDTSNWTLGPGQGLQMIKPKPPFLTDFAQQKANLAFLTSAASVAASQSV